MKIRRATNIGFCFGVKRAVALACDTAKKTPGLYIIGDIVHNEKVSISIQNAGIKKVSSLESVPPCTSLIIKAHGVPEALYRRAKEKKIKVVDATCPMVKDIHRKATQCEKKGYQVLVVGDKKHDEVRGILGHVAGGLVIEHAGAVPGMKKKLMQKAAVLCQSTQDIDNVASVINALVPCCSELVFFNTICRETRTRQNEIKSLARSCEAVLVVGSKKSANTKRLFDIAGKINKNTFFIQSEKGVRPAWKKFRSIALFGGASTPSEVIDKIERKLNAL